jgi:hypothetical protein
MPRHGRCIGPGNCVSACTDVNRLLVAVTVHLSHIGFPCLRNFTPPSNDQSGVLRLTDSQNERKKSLTKLYVIKHKHTKAR